MFPAAWRALKHQVSGSNWAVYRAVKPGIVESFPSPCFGCQVMSRISNATAFKTQWRLKLIQEGEEGECVCVHDLAGSQLNMWSGAKCETKPKVLPWRSVTVVAARAFGSLHRVTAQQNTGAPGLRCQWCGQAKGAKDQSCPAAANDGWRYATSSPGTLTGEGGKESGNTPVFHSGYSNQDAPLES